MAIDTDYDQFDADERNRNDPDDEGASAEDPEFIIQTSSRSVKSQIIYLTLPKDFFRSPILTDTAYRTKHSKDKVTMITSALLKIAGANTEDVVLSKDIVRRHRERNRTQGAADIKPQFKVEHPDHLALHWDEKLMSMVTGTKME